MSEEIKAFKIHVSDEELDDLKRRLRPTRWPDKETVDDWSQGAPIAYVKDVCRYWAEEYDWRKTEAVCTENLIRVDAVMESPKLAE